MNERSTQAVSPQGPAPVEPLDGEGRPGSTPAVILFTPRPRASSADGARPEPLAAGDVGSEADALVRYTDFGRLALRRDSRTGSSAEAKELLNLSKPDYMGARVDYRVESDWNAQYAVFVAGGLSFLEMLQHMQTWLCGVETGQQSVPSCRECGHSPHHADEGQEIHCTAVKEVDAGPSICACMFDEQTGKWA